MELSRLEADHDVHGGMGVALLLHEQGKPFDEVMVSVETANSMSEAIPGGVAALPLLVNNSTQASVSSMPAALQYLSESVRRT